MTQSVQYYIHTSKWFHDGALLSSISQWTCQSVIEITSTFSLVLLWPVRGTPTKGYYYYSLYIFKTIHVNMNVHVALTFLLFKRSEQWRLYTAFRRWKPTTGSR